MQAINCQGWDDLSCLPPTPVQQPQRLHLADQYSSLKGISRKLLPAMHPVKAQLEGEVPMGALIEEHRLFLCSAWAREGSPVCACVEEQGSVVPML